VSGALGNAGGNPWAGEVALHINGERQLMRLTLGALAELEAGLGEDTLVALVARFEEGAFSSRDVLALIVAGLRGGGWLGGAQDLLSADIAGGPVQAARLAGLLLLRAFSAPVAGDGAVRKAAGAAGVSAAGGGGGQATAGNRAATGARTGPADDAAHDCADEAIARGAGEYADAGSGDVAGAAAAAAACSGGKAGAV
jgi:tail tube GTA-gp10-like protein